MSALPDKTVEAAHWALPGAICNYDEDQSRYVSLFDEEAAVRVTLEAAMAESLGHDRLVVVGEHGEDVLRMREHYLAQIERTQALEAELRHLQKTLAEVRAQRDEWEQIATGYRQRLQASGIGLSRISS